MIGVFTPDEQAEAQTNLDALAAAGGTGRRSSSTPTQNVSQSFVDALNAVRSSGLSCQYMLPTAHAGRRAAGLLQRQRPVHAGAGQHGDVGNVKDRASCSATRGGWYYDVDPSTGATPQTISICDTSCAQMKADPVGRVDILLGCTTIYIVD